MSLCSCGRDAGDYTNCPDCRAKARQDMRRCQLKRGQLDRVLTKQVEMYGYDIVAVTLTSLKDKLVESEGIDGGRKR